MTKGEYVQIILNRPAAKNEKIWSGTPGEKQKAIEGSIDIVANIIATASDDFDFAQEKDFQVTTIADTASYMVKGTNNNCRDVISVTYDTSRRLLDKLTPAEAQSELSSQYSYVYGSDQVPADYQTGQWYIDKQQQGFPVIKLIGTPPADKTLYCWLLLRNIDISLVPDEWRGVVISQVEYDLFGSSLMGESFKRKARMLLSDMIDHYRSVARSNAPVPISDTARARNRRINAKFGY